MWFYHYIFLCMCPSYSVDKYVENDGPICGICILSPSNWENLSTIFKLKWWSECKLLGPSFLLALSWEPRTDSFDVWLPSTIDSTQRPVMQRSYPVFRPWISQSRWTSPHYALITGTETPRRSTWTLYAPTFEEICYSEVAIVAPNLGH